MSTIHTRGIGQIATACQGGMAPLGITVPYAEVTCVACRFRPLTDSMRAVERIFTGLIGAYSAAFRQIGEALTATTQADYEATK